MRDRRFWGRRTKARATRTTRFAGDDYRWEGRREVRVRVLRVRVRVLRVRVRVRAWGEGVRVRVIG